MSNLNEIISRSLGLINYDRSKTIDEQIKTDNKKDVENLKKLGFSPVSKEKYDEFKKSLEKKQNNFPTNLYDIENRFTKKEENVNQEIPYLTFKSIIPSKNIYLPVYGAGFSRDSYIGDKKGGFLDKLGFKMPSIQNTTLAQPQAPLTNKPYITKKVTVGETFNRELAEQYFGSQCLKLSGKHPSYDVGYVKELDFYVEGGSQQRCLPIPYTSEDFTVYDKKTKKNKIDTVEKYQIDLPKSTQLKNGKKIQKSKYKYPKNCKPIEYDACLNLSWNMVYQYNVQDQGSFEFNSFGNTGIGYNSSTTKMESYVACMSDEWFPWYNTFVGYIKKSDYKVSSDKSGKKQGTKCLRKDRTVTGVDEMEKYLEYYNLNSGVMTLNVSTYNVNFTLPEVLITTNQNVELRQNYIDYKYDKNEWLSFGQADIDTYKTYLNSSFIDYVNTVNDQKTMFDISLDDFYGKKSTLINPFMPKPPGGDFMEKIPQIIGGEELNLLQDERIVETLSQKYTPLFEKYQTSPFEILKITSKDYYKENEKLKPNQIVLDYYVNVWNNVLMTCDLNNYLSFTAKNNKKLNSDVVKRYLQNQSKQSYDFNTLNQKPNILGGDLKIGGPDLSDIFKSQREKSLFESNPKDWKESDYIVSYLYKKFGIIDMNDVNLITYKNYLDIANLNFDTSNYPLTIVNGYEKYNEKNITPLTIETTYDKTLNDAIKNGVVYKKQSLAGGEIEIKNYNSIKSDISFKTKKDDSTQPSTPVSKEQRLQNLEINVTLLKNQEDQINKLLNTTIVIMGK